MSRRSVRVLGVQGRAWAVLVRTFWTLSLRATSSWGSTRGTQRSASIRTAWWLYGFFGLVLAISLALNRPSLGGYGLLLGSGTFLLIGLAVLADFATIVIAPGEDEILFHLPLSSRTYLAARLAVAALHTAILTAFFAAPAAVIAGLVYRSPLLPPLLLASQVATALLALVVAFALYRLGLRFLGTERFKDLLAYLPVAISLLLYLGPQMLPRAHAGGVAVDPGAWAIAFPPGWFTAVPEVLLGERDPTVLWRALLGVLALPAAAALLVGALGRGYVPDLLRLLGSAERAVPDRPRPVAPGPLARRLSGARSPEAAAGYLLYAGAMRSRDSRARVFGIMALPVVMVVLALVRPEASFFSPVVAIYLLGGSGGSLVAILPFHEHHAAGWLYESVPLRFGRFYAGVLGALVLRHLLPPFLVLLAIVVVRGAGPAEVASSLHAFFAGLLAIPFVSMLTREVPFGRPFAPGETSFGAGVILAEMLFLGALGALHWALGSRAPGVFFATAPALLLVLLLWLRALALDLDRRPPRALRA